MGFRERFKFFPRRPSEAEYRAAEPYDSRPLPSEFDTTSRHTHMYGGHTNRFGNDI
jgi:hypothetical protein